MKIKAASGSTMYGAGVNITLTRDEVAQAIFEWIASKGVKVEGPRTIISQAELMVYVDPSGSVSSGGMTIYGNGAAIMEW